jgi:hypothetical protein
MPRNKSAEVERTDRRDTPECDGEMDRNIMSPTESLVQAIHRLQINGSDAGTLRILYGRAAGAKYELAGDALILY